MAWRCISPGPHGDLAYFRSAKAALRKLHRAGFCHNDLAKEQNWLRGTDGSAYLTDFQLSALLQAAQPFLPARRLRRPAASSQAQAQLCARRADADASGEILARRVWLTRFWMVTGKHVYISITRGLFSFTDREGGGPRLVTDAPLIASRLKSHPQVQDVVVLAFPDRRVGTGLYAFIEGRSNADEKAIHDFMVTEDRPRQGAGAHPACHCPAPPRRRLGPDRDPAAHRDEFSSTRSTC